MKFLDVPTEAWAAAGTPIPTMMVEVCNWWALYQTLTTSGWIVLDTNKDDLRVTTLGSVESKLFKDFRNYANHNHNVMLNAKRIGETRWCVTIGAPYKRKPRK